MLRSSYRSEINVSNESFFESLSHQEDGRNVIGRDNLADIELVLSLHFPERVPAQYRHQEGKEGGEQHREVEIFGHVLGVGGVSGISHRQYYKGRVIRKIFNIFLFLLI